MNQFFLHSVKVQTITNTIGRETVVGSLLTVLQVYTIVMLFLTSTDTFHRVKVLTSTDTMGRVMVVGSLVTVLQMYTIVCWEGINQLDKADRVWRRTGKQVSGGGGPFRLFPQVIYIQQQQQQTIYIDIGLSPPPLIWFSYFS